ncbi:MAG: hypothetical protein A2Y25_05080 [Candidatus Melainabacteria bacterium GWF2_37_15]|nr:MAG: hypothetical protein A2Y25_05080 [Candidatus Melainabacteria bacterium GWF2_37_15]
MTDFQIKKPEIKDPQEIEDLSLKTISREAATYPAFNKFYPEEQKVAQRMIHTTTCFEQIINNIYFSDNATTRIKDLLKNGAAIITDTNMIKAGLSKNYTEKYGNNVICYVAEVPRQEGVTRTDTAVKKALEECNNKPMILACGNAPTFLYAAIEYIVKEKLEISNIALIAMPVGFINVVESKEYTLEFMQKLDVQGIVLKGRYGGSPLVVSTLHALYKAI